MNLTTKIGFGLLFLSILNLSAQNRIVSSEYWFDNEIDSKTELTISPSPLITISEEVDISSLPIGLHTIHFRFLDDNSRWSSPVSRFFIKTKSESEVGTNSLQEYQYWFDNDHSLAINTSLPLQKNVFLDEDLDISALRLGLHTLNIRIRDSWSQWSPTVSRFFIHPGEEPIQGDNSLVKAEYWIDNNIENLTELPVIASKTLQIIEDIDVTALGQGLHTISLRFKDAQNRSSSALTSFFIKLPDQLASEVNQLTEMEYWYDNNIASSVKTPLEAGSVIEFIDDIDISHLQPGLHTVSLRFRDSKGNSSPAVSRFFVKLLENNNQVDNKITAYRHWFDDSEIFSKELLNSEKELVLIDTVDMRLMKKGEYIIHFQFMDEQGLWSSAVSDTVQKLSFPYAMLSADQFKACLMDSILFSAFVVDADRIEWDFGDLGTGAEFNLKYAYSQAGNYQVLATVTDTTENLSYKFELENSIEIYSLPVIDLGESIDLCAGEEVSIVGPSGMKSYTWSNGGDDQSMIVHAGGRYYLVVEDANSCLAQDSVDVIIRALPVIDLGEDISILINESETVNAGEGFSSYAWNDIAGSNLYTVSGSDFGLGDHILRVEVENEFGCVNSDTIQITVSAIDALGELVSVEFNLYPNPVADFVRIEWSRNLMEELQITIVDLSGKPMISGILRESGEAVNVAGLKAGAYYLIMKIGSETKTLPLVKI